MTYNFFTPRHAVTLALGNLLEGLRVAEWGGHCE